MDRIGFVVEDAALGAIAYEVARKLRARVRREHVVSMKGDRLTTKGKAYVRDLISRGCRTVILLKDREGPPGALETQFQREGYPNESHLVVAEREAESWFLADEEALSDYLSAHIHPIANPESLLDPKAKLKDLFQRVRGLSYYETGRDPRELAQRLRPDLVASRCPSFQRFLEAVQS